MAPTRFFNSLYWRLSATFLVIMLLVGSAYVLVSTRQARLHFQEVSQRLGADIAAYIVEQVQPLAAGRINQTGLESLFRYVRITNPSIDVYILDPEGKILAYSVPPDMIKMPRIPLEPVRRFVATRGNEFIQGEDPCNPGLQKVVSAAPIMDGSGLKGYVYVILVGKAYDMAMNQLLSSYIMQLSLKGMAITLLAALLIGLLLFWLITRSLSTTISTVQAFQDGNLQARIPVQNGGELAALAYSFNTMADTITASLESLESAGKLRRELLANISHDLRTPLSLMQGYMETLLMKVDSLDHHKIRKYLEIVLQSTEKLRNLVNDLFELSKLEAGLRLKMEPFFIHELVQDLLQKYTLAAHEKEIKIVTDTPQNLPLVFADISLIDRVLQNLIDNALKFVPRNGTISMVLREQPGAVEVRITDSGPGINQEELPFIFDRYRKGASTTTSDAQGTGLGLAIVKKILELHGQTIHVESETGKGTSFCFRLPVYTEGSEKYDSFVTLS